MSLAPSERVLLHARAFAGAPSMSTGKEELLLDPETKVALAPLAESMLAAVVLGAERAGQLTLEARQRKALFGLRTVTDLVAVRNRAAAPLPAGSLEQRLEAHFKDGQRDVGDLLHDVMEEDTSAPAEHALSLVKRGLHERGLLDTEERTRLKVFKSKHFVANDALRAAAAAHDAAEVRALLDACERERPEIWKLLRKEIGQALANRREASTSDGPDFD